MTTRCRNIRYDKLTDLFSEFTQLIVAEGAQIPRFTNIGQEPGGFLVRLVLSRHTLSFCTVEVNNVPLGLTVKF